MFIDIMCIYFSYDSFISSARPFAHLFFFNIYTQYGVKVHEKNLCNIVAYYLQPGILYNKMYRFGMLFRFTCGKISDKFLTQIITGNV